MSRLFTEQPVQRRRPGEAEPKTVEQILSEQDLSDAAAWQQAAALNASAILRGRLSVPPRAYVSTELLAQKQYAYARYLLGIDEDYLDLPGARLPARPHRTAAGAASY